MSRSRTSRLVAAIGVFRLLKAVLLLVAGLFALGIGKRTEDGGIDSVAHEIVKRIRLDPTNHWVHAGIARLTGLDPARLKLIGAGTFVYAALFAAEGIGLLAGRAWAEWLTVVSTSLLLPFEVYHLAGHPTPGAACVIAINAAIVGYLFQQVRRRQARTAQSASDV